jgi:hypothetical protein
MLVIFLEKINVGSLSKAVEIKYQQKLKAVDI